MKFETVHAERKWHLVLAGKRLALCGTPSPPDLIGWPEENRREWDGEHNLWICKRCLKAASLLEQKPS